MSSWFIAAFAFTLGFTAGMIADRYWARKIIKDAMEIFKNQ